MYINSQNSILNYKNRQEDNIQQEKRVSFTGIPEVVVATMDGIESGGLAASFTIQDMLGTNIPRVGVALNRNKDQTGHLNYQHAAEVALREFITGPSMFIIPAIILYTCKGLFGSALNVPVNSIDIFSEIFKTKFKYKEIQDILQDTNLKKTVYSEIFQNVLRNSCDKELKKDAKDLATNLEKLDNLQNNNNFFKRHFDKNIKGQIKSARDTIITNFVDLVKKNKSDDANVNFSMAKFKLGDKESKASIDNLISQMQDYYKDLEKTLKAKDGKAQSVVNSFKKLKIGSRFALNLFMAGSVISFFSIIPKIYTLTKKNPALDGLIEEKKEEVK